jgi:hypothetical protein
MRGVDPECQLDDRPGASRSRMRTAIAVASSTGESQGSIAAVLRSASWKQSVKM